jgi:hypothetical protein
MLARLGNVLFVAGCIIAAPFVFLAYAASDVGPTPYQGSIFFLIIGAIPVSIGWACRYVLRGR